MKQKEIYLLGFYSTKPREGVNTSVRGWMSNTDNLQYDEKVEIVRGIKGPTAGAKIRLNLSTKTVEFNGFNGDTDFKSMFKYFFGGYHKYITAIMTQLDPEYLSSVLDELQAEMEAAEVTATE